MNEEIKPENMRIYSRADELIACLEGEIAKRDARMAELEKELQAGATAVENCELFRAELAALKAQEPVAEIALSDDGYKIGLLGALRNHRLPIGTKLYAAPVSEAKRSAAELFSGVLMCQRNQVETLAGDPYMVGLYNGMSMMIANFDDSPDFERLSVSEAKAQGSMLQKIGKRLAELLDEDQFAEVEQMLASLNAAPAAPAADAGVSDQQAQRIGELEGLLRSCLPALSDGGCAALANRIDAALSAGREPKQCT